MSIKSAIEELRTIDLSEIRIDNIGSWPLVVRIVACILAFVGVLSAFYFLKVNDLNEQLDREVREESRLRTDYSAKAYDASNLEEYRVQMVDLESRLEALIGQLPSDTEVPGLLEDVTETGLNSGLQIQSIALQSEVAHDYYVELPILIEATGGYHDFAGFVSGVAGLSRIVTLHDFTIDTDPDGQTLLSLSIIAKTYRYKAEQEGGDS